MLGQAPDLHGRLAAVAGGERARVDVKPWLEDASAPLVPRHGGLLEADEYTEDRDAERLVLGRQSPADSLQDLEELPHAELTGRLVTGRLQGYSAGGHSMLVRGVPVQEVQGVGRAAEPLAGTLTGSRPGSPRLQAAGLGLKKDRPCLGAGLGLFRSFPKLDSHPAGKFSAESGGRRVGQQPEVEPKLGA